VIPHRVPDEARADPAIRQPERADLGEDGRPPRVVGEDRLQCRDVLHAGPSGVRSGSSGRPYPPCPIRGNHCDTNSRGDELRMRCAHSAHSRHGVVSRRPRTANGRHRRPIRILGIPGRAAAIAGVAPVGKIRDVLTAMTKGPFGPQAPFLQPLQAHGVSLSTLPHEELVFFDARLGWANKRVELFGA
jgi:hypothetical protein